MPRKTPSCYRLQYYLRSYFLYWSFSYTSFNLSQRKELISLYHMWHFPWRGDNGRGRYKRTLRITILCLFCERLEPHLDPEALDFNFNLSILSQWPFPFTAKKETVFSLTLLFFKIYPLPWLLSKNWESLLESVIRQTFFPPPGLWVVFIGMGIIHPKARKS